MERLAEKLSRGGGAARLSPAQRLEGQDGERVDVGGGLTHRLPCQALRRDVRERPDDLVLGRDLGQIARRRGAEVDELDPPVGGDQDVRRLDVAMDDTVRVGVVEGRGEVAEDAQELLCVHAVLPDQVGERPPGDVLHHDQDAVVARDRVEDRDEVRVEQRGSDPRLATEPLHVGVGAVGVQTLDGDIPPQNVVLGQEDGRHAASPEPPPNAIPTGEHDPGPDLRRYRHRRQPTHSPHEIHVREEARDGRLFVWSLGAAAIQLEPPHGSTGPTPAPARRSCQGPALSAATVWSAAAWQALSAVDAARPPPAASAHWVNTSRALAQALLLAVEPLIASMQAL